MEKAKSEYLSKPEFFKIFHRQGYRILGSNAHSAVKICRWTGESLRNGRVCYKELWYPPVKSHQCMMMTPYLGCNCSCLYCWRLHSSDRPELNYQEFPLKIGGFDEPSQILNQAIQQRSLLLSGWKGNRKSDPKKVVEAMKPKMMTMSLSGEPTLYPYCSQLIEEALKQDIITFLVTNGTSPELLEKMDPLPFQTYISISAPNERLYRRIVRPQTENAWIQLDRSLQLFPSLDTRKVIRLTMIRGLNMTHPNEYARIIKKSQPDYIEVKAYEWVGASQKRLTKKAMPYMSEIMEFASTLSRLTGYTIKGKFQPSGVVLLG